jgi:hypothetical protein
MQLNSSFFISLSRRQSVNLQKLIENGLIYFYCNDSDNNEDYLRDGYDESIDPSGRFISVTLPLTPEPQLHSSSTLSHKMTELLPLLSSYSPSSSTPPPVVFLDDLTAIELCFEDNGRSLISALHSYLASGLVAASPPSLLSYTSLSTDLCFGGSWR